MRDETRAPSAAKHRPSALLKASTREVELRLSRQLQTSTRVSIATMATASHPAERPAPLTHVILACQA